MLLDVYFVVYYIEFKLSVNTCTYMLMNIVIEKNIYVVNQSFHCFCNRDL